MIRMATHFQAVKFTPHSVSVHFVHGSDQSHYQGKSLHFPFVQQGRMFQCVASTKHLVPVCKYAMIVTSSSGQNDCVNQCLHQTHVTNTCPAPSILLETTEMPRHVSGKADHYADAISHDDNVTDNAASVTYGLRGVM